MVARVEVMRSYDFFVVETFLQIEGRLFSEVLTDHEYYREFLENPKNTTAVLVNEDEIVGYACICPHNDAVEELKKYDPGMSYRDSPDGFYFEMMAVLPTFREKNHSAFLKLVARVLFEAEHSGGFEASRWISFHARVSNGFYKHVLKIFPELNIVREIENWLGTGEKTVYIEGSLNDESVKMLHSYVCG